MLFNKRTKKEIFAIVLTCEWSINILKENFDAIELMLFKYIYILNVINGIFCEIEIVYNTIRFNITWVNVDCTHFVYVYWLANTKICSIQNWF